MKYKIGDRVVCRLAPHTNWIAYIEDEFINGKETIDVQIIGKYGNTNIVLIPDGDSLQGNIIKNPTSLGVAQEFLDKYYWNVSDKYVVGFAKKRPCKFCNVNRH